MSNVAHAYRQYICRACGLIYDEAEGDPDSGLAPGTRFEDIPDDWECPLCAVTKSDFELLEKRKAVATSEPTTFSRDTGIVIVGAGLAGWAAIEAIRQIDNTVPITLVCACNGDRYHKPELSVALGRGLTPKKLVRETASQASTRLGVHLLNKTFATGLTTDTKQLRTTRGTLNYTHLILALGSRPYLPPQFSADNCWLINNLRCWSALAEQLQTTNQKVAIVGAGMIGCEIAEDIASAGHDVTLVNRADYPLAHMLPEKAGYKLIESMAELGIKHRSFSMVSSVKNNAHNKPIIHFADSTNETFDHVIVATGLHTESRLAQQAGLAFKNGIVVDPEQLNTSAKDVYALGDCISINGEACRFIEPIVHQAKTIAHGIFAAEIKPYKHKSPIIRLKIRSLPIVIHGQPLQNHPWAIVEDSDKQLVMAQQVNGKINSSLRLKLLNTTEAA